MAKFRHLTFESREDRQAVRVDQCSIESALSPSLTEARPYAQWRSRLGHNGPSHPHLTALPSPAIPDAKMFRWKSDCPPNVSRALFRSRAGKSAFSKRSGELTRPAGNFYRGICRKTNSARPATPEFAFRASRTRFRRPPRNFLKMAVWRFNHFRKAKFPVAPATSATALSSPRSETACRGAQGGRHKSCAWRAHLQFGRRQPILRTRRRFQGDGRERGMRV